MVTRSPDPVMDTGEVSPLLVKLMGLVKGIGVAFHNVPEQDLRLTGALHEAIVACHDHVYPANAITARIERSKAALPEGQELMRFDLLARLTPEAQDWIAECYEYHTELHADRVADEGEDEPLLKEWRKALDDIETAISNAVETGPMAGSNE